MRDIFHYMYSPHSERDAGYAQRIISLLDGQVVPEVKL